MPSHDPDDLLTDLDPAQREAVLITSGPLCILAGAGSGKTRVISRRVGYALATGVVRPRDVLVVTFTDKAAGEMRTRLAALGQPGVAASTFHAAALRQLRHFWPRVHGSDPPSILESKVPILAPLAAGLPGGYRFLAVRDLAGEIEWAKARRIRPNEYEMRAIDDDRDASLPPDLMATLYRRYETAKARAGRIDFEDMLELTIGLIESDDADRGRGARPLSLVLGRRVPGHEPAPGGAPRRMARRAPGSRGRRRRGPDDLHVHRRDAAIT